MIIFLYSFFAQSPDGTEALEIQDRISSCILYADHKKDEDTKAGLILDFNFRKLYDRVPFTFWGRTSEYDFPEHRNYR